MCCFLKQYLSFLQAKLNVRASCVSHDVKESFAGEIWNPGLWNPEYVLKESGIILTIGIQNPSST